MFGCFEGRGSRLTNGTSRGVNNKVDPAGKDMGCRYRLHEVHKHGVEGVTRRRFSGEPKWPVTMFCMYDVIESD